MSTLPGVTLLLLLVAAVLVAVLKGSRSPQPLPSNPTPDKTAMLAALIPVACSAISYATFKALDLYLSHYPVYQGKPPFATATDCILDRQRRTLVCGCLFRILRCSGSE